MALDTEDWVLLGNGPTIVFALIAFGAGKATPAEKRRFSADWADRLFELNFPTSPTLNQIFSNVKAEARLHYDDVILGRRDRLLAKVRKLGDLMRTGLHPDDAEALRRGMLSLAEEVLRAPRGRFGIGQDVAQIDRETLRRIKSALRS
jgi:hypothetical protein